MADYTTAQSSSTGGWIIGGIVIVLLLLFVLFANSGPAPEGAVGPDGTAIVEPVQPLAPATTD